MVNHIYWFVEKDKGLIDMDNNVVNAGREEGIKWLKGCGKKYKIKYKNKIKYVMSKL